MKKIKRLFLVSMTTMMILFFISNQSYASIELLKNIQTASGEVSISSGGCEISNTFGESIASAKELFISSYSVLYGYLSIIPTSSLSVDHITSTNTITTSIPPQLWGVRQTQPVLAVLTDEAATESISSNTVITELYDYTGAQINSTIAVNYNMIDSTNLEFKPAEWKKGSLYSAYFSTGITDINNEPLEKPQTFYFSVILDTSNTSTVVLINDKTRITLKESTSSNDYFIVISTIVKSDDIDEANSKLLVSNSLIKEPVKYLKITPYNMDGNEITSYPFTGQSDKYPVTIKTDYEDNDNNGLLDGLFPLAKASNLSLWKLDKTKNRWVKLPYYDIDTSNKELSARGNEFTIYAMFPKVATDVSDVIAYPVPFRPNAGNPNRYGSWADGIRFANCPGIGTIKLYTIAGDLVRKIDIESNIDANSEVKWNLKNDSGNIVASGVYIWEVVSGDNRKTGKLMVIK